MSTIPHRTQTVSSDISKWKYMQRIPLVLCPSKFIHQWPYILILKGRLLSLNDPHSWYILFFNSRLRWLLLITDHLSFFHASILLSNLLLTDRPHYQHSLNQSLNSSSGRRGKLNGNLLLEVGKAFSGSHWWAYAIAFFFDCDDVIPTQNI